MVRPGLAVVAVSLSLAACLVIVPSAPALAQVPFILRPPGLLLPGFLPPGPVLAYGSPFAMPRHHAPLPPAEIVAILLEEYQFRRVGRPQFAGGVYLVEGVDDAGAVVRAHVHAHSGRLLQVELLQRQRLARLPATPEPQRAIPFPPRRPVATPPGVTSTGPVAQPSLQPSLQPALSPALTSPVVPLSREPRIVDPAQTRGLDEPDRTPPLAAPGRTASPDPG
jgi:hypothetical protein